MFLPYLGVIALTADGVSEGARYWAFISYSHQDARFGRQLHRRLESYALPHRLVGRVTAQGQLKRRLTPIFRDRDELPAANDLSAKVREALRESRSLIVVCSPAAAASSWVSREVEVFRELHPDRPILAAVIEGEPSECFPAALNRVTPAGEQIEPLAADFRVIGDGNRLGLLKLVAGICGIGLDELIQRDAQKRIRRVTAITAAALAAMIGMGVLTAFALKARSEAVRQRAEAEGLVEFMLTDLRTTLKGVGRLDAMHAVNERALRYYADEDVKTLSPASLERRARILHAMGEDDEARDDHQAALLKFREARRTTGALLAAAPNDPDRIFEHAQSEFWIGQVAYANKQFSAAKIAFEAYKHLADRLVAQDSKNPKYLREAGYAEGDLCTLALTPPVDGEAALLWCTEALKHMEAAGRFLGTAEDIEQDIANRHAWLADAYRANKDKENARAHRLIQAQILDGQMRRHPNDMQLKYRWLGVQRVLGRMEADAGERERALNRFRDAIAVSSRMTAFDPSNKNWAKLDAGIKADMAQIYGTSLKGESK